MKQVYFFVKLFSFVLLIFIWEYTFISYRELPDIIPIHFGLDGTPDGFSTKKMSWLLPFISTFIFGLLFYLSKNQSSSLLNLPSNIKENKTLSSNILHFVNLIVMVLFSVITYESINVALEKSSRLSSATLCLVALLFLGIIGIMIYSNYLKKTETKTSNQ